MSRDDLDPPDDPGHTEPDAAPWSWDGLCSPPLHADHPPPASRYAAAFGRTPPHSLDDERAVLCACLLEDSDRASVTTAIGSDPGVFYAESHQRIYRAIQAAPSPDFLSVTTWLDAQGWLLSLGDETSHGRAYLSALLLAPSLSPSGLLVACLRIRQAHALRAIAETCSLVAADAHKPGADPLDLLKRVERVERIATATQPAPAEGHGFALIEPAEIYTVPGPIEYTIDPLVRPGSLAVIGAYGGSKKTWVAIDALLSVGTGLPWLGRFACCHGGATFMDYESGAFELSRRIRLVSTARDIGGATAPLINICCTPGIYMTDASFKARVLRLASNRKLIIFDSLVAMSGGIDENSSQMRAGLDILREIAELTTCAFLVLAHAKKLGANGGDETDERETLRGSSAIYDACDSVLTIALKGNRAQVKQTKARHGRKIEPFDLIVDDAPLGGVIVQASDPVVAPGTATPADTRSVVRKAIVAIIAKAPHTSAAKIEDELSTQGLIGKPGLARADVRTLFAVMVEDGHIARHAGTGKGGGVRYSPIAPSKPSPDESASP